MNKVKFICIFCGKLFTKTHYWTYGADLKYLTDAKHYD